jgi:hypothetical protein
LNCWRAMGLRVWMKRYDCGQGFALGSPEPAQTISCAGRPAWLGQGCFSQSEKLTFAQARVLPVINFRGRMGKRNPMRILPSGKLGHARGPCWRCAFTVVRGRETCAQQNCAACEVGDHRTTNICVRGRETAAQPDCLSRSERFTLHPGA